ncbi:lipoprotein insertase outer membrane protein LolB [Diaphorobacter caeni]|uniref:lipoprotein insertase outer membrane protein LolB n=1 Tax=Diaphorobacter caeni TaxID=2784387 RepID=UPI00188F7BC3|nr:lipoprotein insertase outer membrane protein LolB [Diaphorobacter caeni]MBF5003555.1 outer membrane lipoprotein LolB [Diaphorobacter caeni]
MSQSLQRRAVVLGAAALLAGCAQPKREPGVAINGEDFWTGRLGLQVDEGAEKNFSAGFDLSGDAGRGKLTLYNPLGNVLAKLQWSPGLAMLDSPDQKLESDSLSALLIQLTGNDLPIQALFGWLRGVDVKVTGWSADLSRMDSGRLTATRISPQPGAVLRIVLER